MIDLMEATFIKEEYLFVKSFLVRFLSRAAVSESSGERREGEADRAPFGCG
jgi:hypothetical protein